LERHLAQLEQQSMTISRSSERERHDLQCFEALLAEEVTAVRIVIADDPADLVLDHGSFALKELTMPDHGPMGTLTGGGAIGGGNHVQGQGLGQDLRVELIGLSSALGDDSEFARLASRTRSSQRLDAFQQHHS